MDNFDNHKQNGKYDDKQNDVFVAYKKEGETPLECLLRLKEEGFLPFDSKFTYAGRLDPMAEGMMIYLRGEAITDKAHFLGLEKEYEVEILLGVGTDTGDILGLINKEIKESDGNTSNNGDIIFDIKNVGSICESFVGDLEVPYPWFSSRTVNGKALHVWAKEAERETSEGGEDDENGNGDFRSEEEKEDGRNDFFERPMTKLSIKDIEFLDFRLISNTDLLDNVLQRIKKVKGDFRQDEIVQKWNHYIKSHKSEFPLIKIRVRCGSGSYMRTLAELIGEKLNVPALAYSIKRVSIGEYKV